MLIVPRNFCVGVVAAVQYQPDLDLFINRSKPCHKSHPCRMLSVPSRSSPLLSYRCLELTFVSHEEPPPPAPLFPLLLRLCYHQPVATVVFSKVLYTDHIHCFFSGLPTDVCSSFFLLLLLVLAELDHPCVVKLIEVFNSETHVFMAMETVDGRKLHEELTHLGRIDETRARDLFQQVGNESVVGRRGLGGGFGLDGGGGGGFNGGGLVELRSVAEGTSCRCMYAMTNCPRFLVHVWFGSMRRSCSHVSLLCRR